MKIPIESSHVVTLVHARARLIEMIDALAKGIDLAKAEPEKPIEAAAQLLWTLLEEAVAIRNGVTDVVLPAIETYNAMHPDNDRLDNL